MNRETEKIVGGFIPIFITGVLFLVVFVFSTAFVSRGNGKTIPVETGDFDIHAIPLLDEGNFSAFVTTTTDPNTALLMNVSVCEEGLRSRPRSSLSQLRIHVSSTTKREHTTYTCDISLRWKRSVHKTTCAPLLLSLLETKARRNQVVFIFSQLKKNNLFLQKVILFLSWCCGRGSNPHDLAVKGFSYSL